MKKAPRVFSNTLDASKAAAFYDRMHALKDALEALQAQYTADLAEVVEEASESLSVDPGLFRMAFTQERQKRKREAKIAKMEDYKAVQLDLLGDAACGSDGLERRVPARAPVSPKLARAAADFNKAVGTPVEPTPEEKDKGVIGAWVNKDGTRCSIAVPGHDPETGEIIEPKAPPAAPKPMMDVTGEIPSFLRRELPKRTPASA